MTYHRPQVEHHRGAHARRLGYLDLFRGLAVLSMIQGHTFTVVLARSAYGEGWLPWYTLVHGLTAPMFLVGGGLAYGVVSLRRGAHESAWNVAIVRRALILVSLGYGLQLPSAPWREIFGRPDLQQKALQVGPVQLVGVCLLCCELVRTRSRGRVWFAAGLSAMLTLTTVVAPWAWQLRMSTNGPLFVGTWLDGYRGSLFPFFPWAAFFFLGVLLAWPTLRMRERALALHRQEIGFASVLVVLGAGLSYGMFSFYQRGLVLREVYGDYELWHTSPLYVVFRAGLVIACLGVLCALEPIMRRLALWFPRLASLFGTLARQSLVAYVAHLLMLYGSPLNRGLVRLGATLSLTQAFVSFGGVLALTILVTHLWEHFVTSGRLRRLVWSTLDAGRVWCARQIDGIGEG